MKWLVNFLYTAALGMLALVIFIVMATCLQADMLEVKELSIDYKNFGLLNDKARNSLIYPEHPKEGIDLNLNLSALEVLYWNSTIQSYTTSAKYQSIGLETRLGVGLTQNFDLGLYHHSQHVLDRPHSFMDKFPSEDAVELKVYLIGPNKRETLF